MKKRFQPDFAELMIVNPARPGSGSVLMGENGVFYHVQGFGPVEERPPKGQFFMGDDGSLYRLNGYSSTGRARLVRVTPSGLAGEFGDGFGRFFLGDNGVLYEFT